jgi:protein-arginine kinase
LHDIEKCVIFALDGLLIEPLKQIVPDIMNDEEYRREELIREIEHRVEQMTLRQLEALQYELETKDYSADDDR